MTDEDHSNPTEEVVEEQSPQLPEKCLKRHNSNKEAQSNTQDIESGSLYHTQSHISSHDATAIHHDEPNSYAEAGDEVYNKFSHHHKLVIVTVLSICSFLAPMSSTSILAASPEVVATFNTTGTIFNISNALYMLFMGLSPLLYGPLGTTYGRKWPLSVAAVTFTAFSAGSALAPDLPSYFVFRMLTAFQGTCFLIVGSTVIGDIYRPVERGTAYGWFLSGTLIGPALGPLIGGIIVTYASWRDIFWLQTALAGISSIGVIILVPETIHKKRSDELVGLSRKEKAGKLWHWINPWRVLSLFRYPNVFIVGMASASLVWNMYSLLSPIRFILNPRFHLSSPLQGGLFYIAPGGGYLLGSFFGGRWADSVVKKYIRKRDGKRVPEDRLRSGLIPLGIVIPACMLIYGWSVEKEVGGIPLPVICMFIQGVAQLFCFPSLNTYCLDVMQKRSAEVIAGNYLFRYLFAAAGTAAVLPVVDEIGVGWFSTISAAFLVVAAAGTWMVALYGSQWRETISKKLEEE